jgi:hypothetical protein
MGLNTFNLFKDVLIFDIFRKKMEWTYFTPVEGDPRHVTCNMCGMSISLGADTGKGKTMIGLGCHLRTIMHKDMYVGFEKKLAEELAKEDAIEKASRSSSAGSSGLNVKLKTSLNQRNNNSTRMNLVQQTMPGVINKKTVWTDLHPEAQKIHQTVFEMLVVDNDPWSKVERTGFMHLMRQCSPKF